MKHLIALGVLATVLTGCNAVTAVADGITKKQSTFSQKANTIYPTVDGTKEGEPADFAKAQVSNQEIGQPQSSYATTPTDDYSYSQGGVIYGQ